MRIMSKVLLFIAILLVVCVILYACSAVGGGVALRESWWTIDTLEAYQPVGLLQYHWVDQLPPDLIVPEKRGKNCALVRYESWTRSGFAIPPLTVNGAPNRTKWAYICPSAEDVQRFGRPVTVAIGGFFWYPKKGSAEAGDKGRLLLGGIRLIGEGGWEQGAAVFPENMDPLTEPRDAAGPNPLLLANCKARIYLGDRAPGGVKISRCDEFGFEGGAYVRVTPMSKDWDKTAFVLLQNFDGLRLVAFEDVDGKVKQSRPVDILGAIPMVPIK
jgi:hypothetical protein